MRVSSEVAELDLAPGNHADVTLNVVNTGSVIDGITARVVGLSERNVTTRPQVLPLFPDSSGQLTVTLGLPSSFPAGRHPMTVEVISRQPNISPQYVNLDLVVPTAPAVGLSSRPELVRAHRTGRFVVTVTNRGNIQLDISLRANDPEKAIGVSFEPATLTLPAGTAADSVVTLRGPRMIVGNERDRTVTIGVAARPIGVGTALAPPVGAPVAPGLEPAAPAVPMPGAPTEIEPDPEAQAAPVTDEPLSREIIVTLRQRPWLTRGLLTALILLTIIALWAAAFLFGLKKVFAGDPLTKAAPASFFAATQTATGTGGATGTAGATGTGAGSTAAGQSGTTGAAGTAGSGSAGSAGSGGSAGSNGSGTGQSGGSNSGAPPAGALPKAGTVPTGVGGVVSGTVTAQSSGQPVGRIIVTALRVRADGTTVAEASAATQADGTYEVAGLFPADYVLRFSADGFATSYFPAATAVKGATRVPVTSNQVSPSINGVITGKPATITGSIDYGATTTKAATTITVRMIGGTVSAKPLPAIKTSNGTYAIPNVPAPGTYQLSFSANGYQTTTVQTDVSAGATRYQPTVLMSAGTGQITGTVTDSAGQLLGGVAVSTSINGQTVTTGTPTSGKIGEFTFSNVPMPGTYVITASKDGYSQVTQVIDLTPGVAAKPPRFVLAAGTGTVDGVLLDAVTHAGIGGATVTVGGMANPTTTTTLTAGTVGSFHVTGIPSTGSFTLTFSVQGYADLTVPVPEGAAAQQPMQVTMSRSVGGISGTVTNASGAGLVNVTVSATDGVHVFPVSTTGNATGSGAGGYEIANLPAGVYTVTAADAAGETSSAIVTVTAGSTVSQNFTIPPPGS
jgi:hypothetical protein